MSKLAIAYAMKKKQKKEPKIEVIPHPKEIEDVDPKILKKMKERLKMADGGKVPADPCVTNPDSFACKFKKGSGFADGGMIEKEKASGYMDHEGNTQRPNHAAMSEEEKKLNQHKVDMKASSSMAEQSLVDRIMSKKSKDYSQLDRLAMGGEVDGKSYEDCEQGMVDRIMKKRHGDMNDFSDLDRYSEGGKVANQEHGKDNNELAGFSPNEFDDLVLRDDLEFSYDGENSGDHLGNERENEDRKDIVARIMRSRAKKDRLPKVR